MYMAMFVAPLPNCRRSRVSGQCYSGRTTVIHHAWPVGGDHDGQCAASTQQNTGVQAVCWSIPFTLVPLLAPPACACMHVQLHAWALALPAHRRNVSAATKASVCCVRGSPLKAAVAQRLLDLGLAASALHPRQVHAIGRSYAPPPPAIRPRRRRITASATSAGCRGLLGGAVGGGGRLGLAADSRAGVHQSWACEVTAAHRHRWRAVEASCTRSHAWNGIRQYQTRRAHTAAVGRRGRHRRSGSQLVRKEGVR